MVMRGREKSVEGQVEWGASGRGASLLGYRGVSSFGASLYPDGERHVISRAQVLAGMKHLKICCGGMN